MSCFRYVLIVLISMVMFSCNSPQIIRPNSDDDIALRRDGRIETLRYEDVVVRRYYKGWNIKRYGYFQPPKLSSEVEIPKDEVQEYAKMNAYDMAVYDLSGKLTELHTINQGDIPVVRYSSYFYYSGDRLIRAKHVFENGKVKEKTFD